MTVIALVTADKIEVVESIKQMTLPAAEAIIAGAPVRLDTTSGRWTNANGTTAPEARVWGVATRTVIAGEALTAVRSGVMDGWDLTALAYDANVFVSDTDGKLDTAAGTVSTVVGRVIPATSTPLGTAFDKVLSLELA